MLLEPKFMLFPGDTTEAELSAMPWDRCPGVAYVAA
jgi:hypothetical protein